MLLLVLGLVLKDQADFAKTYVHDQLAAQEIYFKAADKLVPEEEFQATLLESLGSQEAVDAFVAAKNLTSEAGSDCLNKYAGQQMLTGSQAECYAEDYIRLHALESSIVTGTGLQITNAAGEKVDVDGVSYTYASIGAVVTAAKAVVTDLKENGGSEEEIAAAQKQADALQSKRIDTLLRAETLRGLLLTSYGFSIFGDKADLAATVCYIAFALLLLLSLFGLAHAFFSKHAKDVILAVDHPAETPA